MSLHILRLAFGIDSMARLRKRIATNTAKDGEGRQTVTINTRYMPRRAAEILDGGSLYWIVKGQIRARQRILDIADYEPPEGATGMPARRRCQIVLDPQLVLTMPQPRGAQQGWRYLDDAGAPADLKVDGDDTDAPEEMVAELSDLGLI